MEFKLITSKDEAQKVFPIMRELRTHLDEAKYFELLTNAQHEGYKLIAGYDQGVCRGLMGYRILFDFVHGKNLYIDDLVITASARSLGLGAKFLTYAKKIALEENCPVLRLCTGIENEAGKRFYEKNGWGLRAVVYKIKMNLEPDIN